MKLLIENGALTGNTTHIHSLIKLAEYFHAQDIVDMLKKAASPAKLYNEKLESDFPSLQKFSLFSVRQNQKLYQDIAQDKIQLPPRIKRNIMY